MRKVAYTETFILFLRLTDKIHLKVNDYDTINRSATKETLCLQRTPQIEGHTIREYKGIVTGETIIGANMFKDLFAGIRDIVGGRAGAYEKVLSEAKDTSMQEMMQRAQALGANAIVGIDIDYETVGANGSMLMVATSGTAVVI